MTGKGTRLSQDFRNQVSLESEYAQFNQAYWSGTLPPVKLSWELSKTRVGIVFGVLNKKTGLTHPTEMRISAYMKLDRERFEKIFLHEMIHIWQYAEQKNDGHGRLFKKESRRVSRLSGIKIPKTDDISDLEVSEHVSTRKFAVVLMRDGDKEGVMVFNLSIRSRYKDLIAFLKSISADDFWSVIVESRDRDLLKFSVNRKLPRRDLYAYYRPLPGMINRLMETGKLIAEVKGKQI